MSAIVAREIRALTIAVFSALAAGPGGVAGPWLVGTLIDSGSRAGGFAGYPFGAALMVAATAVHRRWGLAAERRSLAVVARPLAAVDRTRWSDRMTRAGTMMPAAEAIDLDTMALLLDIDGTLLDFAPTPREVWVPPTLRRTLGALLARTDGALALVSGRALADLDLLFAPLELPAIGGHGAELRVAAGERSDPARTPALDPMVKRKLASVAELGPGVLIEDKGYSLALHWRLAPDKGDAVIAMVRSICDSFPDLPLEALPGKAVIEVKSATFDKATAVAELMQRPPFAGRRPVFLGDDVTDERVFPILPPLGGFGFAVGRDIPGTAGSFADPTAVRAWLDGLLERET
ncbi:trehalose-phosphatase [Rhodoplanes azumiensis]|uniref:Trehalose 6-phosphate phosphatase n=1 Tax=Rhodoplanes azumiensis TaxID=1897628 RepID=A0ABW5AGE3_9BRAD